MPKGFILFALLFFFSDLLSAQQPFTFERITTAHGLSDNQAIKIHQDKEGFIWIGTMSGLNRYDGKSIKTLHDDVGKGQSSYNQRIMGIQEDGSGNLWLFSFGGNIQMFNKATHAIQNYPNQFGYYPTSVNSQLFLHEDAFAVMAFNNLGVFVIDTRNNTSQLIGQYLFDEEVIKSGTYINSIFATDRNNIWLTTRSGPIYLQINPQTNESTFHRLALSEAIHDGNAGHFITDSKIYFPSYGKGMVVCDLISGSTEIFDIIEGVDIRYLTHIAGYGDHICVVTNDNSLLIVSNDGKNVLYHINQYKRTSLGTITNLFIDSKETIWFRSINFSGIFQLNPSLNKIDFFPCNFSNSELLSKIHIIIFFYEDSRGNIWIGTRQDGVLFYDKSKNSVTQITNYPNNPGSLISNGVLSILEDGIGDIWIGTQFGISKISRSNSAFKFFSHIDEPSHDFDNKTDALFEDSYGNIWCSSLSGELFVYDSYLNQKHIFSGNNPKHGYKNALVFCFLEDAKGRLWIGSKGEGLFLLDLKEYHDNLHHARFAQYNFNVSEQYSIRSNDIYDIIEDSKNRIWFATYGGGLYLLNESENQKRFISYNQFLDPFCPFSIQFGRCLLEDKAGKIWYGGLSGLCSFSVDDEDFLPHSVSFYYHGKGTPNTISYNDIKSLYEDIAGNIWIGTYGGGLSIYSPSCRLFRHYTVNEGLSSNIVYSTISDHKGNIWISTKNGLSKYNPTRDEFVNFSESDGLPDNEFTEAKPFSSNGLLFFGTIRGVTFFNPDHVNVPNPLPDILFTDLLVSNKVQRVNPDGPLIKDINLAESIRLMHDQNNFSITFSTNDFRNDSKYKFDYKLEHFDKEWVRAFNNHYITYTNIPVGEYVLRVRLTDNSDEQLFNEKTLSVIITPPFWRTNWAYFLYTICIILLFVFAIQLFLKFNALRNSLKLEKEITDFKLRFFTNISHELRTPLTLIINPIKEVICELKNLNEKPSEMLRIALHNANNLMRLVNEILDFRKLQDGRILLRVSENEIVSFFNTVTEDFQFVAEKKDIEYERFINAKEKTYWFDSEKLEKIINNLLTNAFKFTPPKGKVHISLMTEAHQVHLIVENTGGSTDLKKRNKSYSRFYKPELPGQNLFAKGVGLGLSLVEEYVKLHKGKIDFISEPTRGTKVIISFPSGKEFYTDLELSLKNEWEAGTESIQFLSQFQEIEKANLEPGNGHCKTKILFVEDNPDMLSMLIQKLSNYYMVLSARNGREGLEAIEEHSPELVVTDWLMPEMSGVELTHAIKNDFQTCHIPVILLTAKSTNEDRVEGYDIGADAYITKPFDFDILISRIKSLLEQRRVLKQRFREDFTFDSRSVAIEKKDQDFIEQVISIVIEHMESDDFTLETLYKELGCSKTVVYKKIKSLTGLSPNQFIRTIKLKEAARLFKSTDLNVAEVAYSIGYSDINYFRAQFKTQFNKTPSEFMKQR